MANYTDQFDEWPFWYGFRVPMGAFGSPTARQFGVPLTFDGDADFIWRARLADVSITPAGFTGNAPSYNRFVTRKFYLPTSEALSNINIYDLAAQKNYDIPQTGLANAGHALNPVPIIPEIRIGKASVMQVDLENRQELSSALTVELCFAGVKLYPKRSRYYVDPAKKYRAEPFDYPVLLPGPGAANQLFLNNVLTLDSDSIFLLLGFATDFAGWDTGGFPGWSFRFFGPNGERTSQSNSTPAPGFISANNLIGIGRREGLVCPPIPYPPGGQITWDYQEAGVPETPPARLGQQFLIFRGVKLYT